jgi:hypothetical protein
MRPLKVSELTKKGVNYHGCYLSGTGRCSLCPVVCVCSEVSAYTDNAASRRSVAACCAGVLWSTVQRALYREERKRRR